jgi:hypothetical protein
MAKFKVGDRVRLIKKGGVPSVPEGTCGVVRKSAADDDPAVFDCQGWDVAFENQVNRHVLGDHLGRA